MDRQQFINILSTKIKAVRVMADLTQDRMAEILGISKKTLVQIEKGRVLAGWPVVVTFSTLFKDSEVLTATFGSDVLEIISVLAFEHYEGPAETTMGGKLWWKEVETAGQFRLQQNHASKHFRILDQEDRRWCSSFNEDEIKRRLRELARLKA